MSVQHGSFLGLLELCWVFAKFKIQVLFCVIRSAKASCWVSGPPNLFSWRQTRAKGNRTVRHRPFSSAGRTARIAGSVDIQQTRRSALRAPIAALSLEQLAGMIREPAVSNLTAFETNTFCKLLRGQLASLQEAILRCRSCNRSAKAA